MDPADSGRALDGIRDGSVSHIPKNRVWVDSTHFLVPSSGTSPPFNLRTTPGLSTSPRPSLSYFRGLPNLRSSLV